MPRFSIVIPTRNGSETLRATLRSVQAVDYEDYEIVVCDNDVGDATARLIEELAIPNLRYVRAPRPLSMSSNWELAVSSALGEFVILLGDDDALLRHSLREIDRLLRETGSRAVRWTAGFYLWPNIEIPGQNNYLRLPLRRTLRRCEAREELGKVIRFEQCYSELPMVYNSAVDRRLFDEIRERAGRVFFARVPDIVSGMAIAWTAGAYVSTTLPMTVAGVSRKSTGLGTLFTPNAVGADWHALNNEEGFGTFDEIPRALIFPAVPVAECFLAARQKFFSDDSELVLDRRVLTRHCMSCLRSETLEGWHAAFAATRDSLRDDPALLAWFDLEYASRAPSVGGPQPLRTMPRAGGDGDYLHLETERFTISDVAGAADICDRILSGQHRNVEYGTSEESDERLRLTKELQRKDAALHEALDDAAALTEQLGEKEAALQSALAASAELRTQLAAKEQLLHELHGVGQRLREQIEEKHAVLEQFRNVMESHTADLQAQKSSNQQLIESNLQLAAATEELRAALVDKHAALHQALSDAAALQQQLLDKHAALHEALDCVEGLRARRLWDRIRNAG